MYIDKNQLLYEGFPMKLVRIAPSEMAYRAREQSREITERFKKQFHVKSSQLGKRVCVVNFGVSFGETTIRGRVTPRSRRRRDARGALTPSS